MYEYSKQTVVKKDAIRSLTKRRVQTSLETLIYGNWSSRLLLIMLSSVRSFLCVNEKIWRYVNVFSVTHLTCYFEIEAKNDVLFIVDSMMIICHFINTFQLYFSAYLFLYIYFQYE